MFWMIGKSKDSKTQIILYPAKKSRSYAYCYDTKYNEEIITLVMDVDLLYHEGTFLHGQFWKGQRQLIILQPSRLGYLRKTGNVGHFVDCHFSIRYKELSFHC